MKPKPLAVCAFAAGSLAQFVPNAQFVPLAHAQPRLTLYGNVDLSLGHIRSETGRSVTALYDGAISTSRIGLRGSEALGEEYELRFQLESGFNADTGELSDDARFFDRQAWIGVRTPAGEFRVGRQETQIQAIGDAIDYTERETFGSLVNTLGFPSRYNNDIAWISPRIADVQVVLHYAPGESTGGGASEGVIYQLGVDWTRGAWRAGYAGLTAKPLAEGPIRKRVQYHNVYGTYDYGQGTVYFAFVRSNNITASTEDGVTTNSAGTILNNDGDPDNTFPGTNPDLRRFHHVYQVSLDYRLSGQLRVGALIGVIRDQSDAANDVKGGNIGAVYELSKRTTLYGFASVMKNSNDAGFQFSSSGSASSNLSGMDVNGKRLTGYQVGIVHRF